MKCNWTFALGKNQFMECGMPAVWLNGRWILCNHHKFELLNAYTEKHRMQDSPKWTLISDQIDYQI
jgi:hypothetical protein